MSSLLLVTFLFSACAADRYKFKLWGDPSPQQQLQCDSSEWSATEYNHALKYINEAFHPRYTGSRSDYFYTANSFTNDKMQKLEQVMNAYANFWQILGYRNAEYTTIYYTAKNTENIKKLIPQEIPQLINKFVKHPDGIRFYVATLEDFKWFTSKRQLAQSWMAMDTNDHRVAETMHNHVTPISTDIQIALSLQQMLRLTKHPAPTRFYLVYDVHPNPNKKVDHPWKLITKDSDVKPIRRKKKKSKEDKEEPPPVFSFCHAMVAPGIGNGHDLDQELKYISKLTKNLQQKIEELKNKAVVHYNNYYQYDQYYDENYGAYDYDAYYYDEYKRFKQMAVLKRLAKYMQAYD